jgi:predicted GIY-YIG superfamily endonuclease
LSNQEDPTQKKACNCQKKNQCPLDGNCLQERTVYEATVTCEDPTYKPRKYIGSAETTFKKRFANHKKSFNIEKYQNETELAKEVWRLKRKNMSPCVSWETIRSCRPFNRAAKKCDLCLNEKLEIAMHPDALLNSRTELVSKCRHINKFMLAKLDSND